jgi:hypothetical protein
VTGSIVPVSVDGRICDRQLDVVGLCFEIIVIVRDVVPVFRIETTARAVCPTGTLSAVPGLLVVV